MNEKNVEFNNYVEEFKKLNTKDKLEEIIVSLKEVMSFFEVLGLTENISYEYLKSREILDLEKEAVSTDDYLEAILVYIENSKELLAQYLENKKQ